MDKIHIGVMCPRCGHLVKTQGRVEANPVQPEDVEKLKDTKLDMALCPACGTESPIVNNRKFLVCCSKCHKKFPRRDQELSAEEVFTLSEKQQQLLNIMGICGQFRNSREAAECVLAVTSIIEETLCKHFFNFNLLPSSEKLPVIAQISNSPQFEPIYFGNEEEIDMEFLIEKASVALHGDKDLESAMKKYINESNFKLSIKYIDDFILVNYQSSIDHDKLVILALKAFGRGFGNKLKPEVGGSYKRQHGATLEKDNKVDESALLKLYTKPSPHNRELTALLEENGFEAANDGNQGGCLGLIMIAGLLGAGITFWF
jgi:endogenous inhibitor of DNA gyrase (YacG/DUF329 family)